MILMRNEPGRSPRKSPGKSPRRSPWPLLLPILLPVLLSVLLSTLLLVLHIAVNTQPVPPSPCPLPLQGERDRVHHLLPSSLGDNVINLRGKPFWKRVFPLNPFPKTFKGPLGSQGPPGSPESQGSLESLEFGCFDHLLKSLESGWFDHLLKSLESGCFDHLLKSLESGWFDHLKVRWQNLRPFSPQKDQLRISDRLRIHPKAASILGRDSVSFPLAEGEKGGMKEMQVLQAILARPEFQYNQLRKDQVQWPSRYLNWFYLLLKKITLLMEKVFGGRKKRFKVSKHRQGLLAWFSNPWVIYGLMSAMAITMLVLLAKFGQSLLGNEKEGETLPQQQGALNLPDSLRESPGYWSKQADLLISQGKTREAFRSLYLALLVGFHRLNYIDFHRCRTNWNYLTHFRGDQQARKLLQEMTQRFDLVWYGSHSLAQDEYQRYEQAIRGALNV
jgi:hypothetical protein